MSLPRATARLQFHKDFTFDDAAALVDYFARMGISHVYASPILTARSGSLHGYDITDPTRINPELGGEEAFRRLVAYLRRAGLGLIADIVPNHMATGAENPWWQSVLEWGRDSPYAQWFDIDWEVADPALRGKLLAPFLGEPYGAALDSGNLQLKLDAVTGKLFVAYYDNRYPLAPSCWADVLRTAGSSRLEPAIAACERVMSETSAEARIAGMDAVHDILRDLAADADAMADIDAALAGFSPGMPHGVQALHLLLERQHYRLSWWRNAAEEINWRRFFEVSDLAGVRVELEEVFEATHALIFRLYAEGLIDGVRVDHVDGLAHPGAYCRKLRARLTELTPRRPPGLEADPPYIIVEKILEPHEHLRTGWQVDGTTGYEFMDQVGALLHDPAGETPLTELWTSMTGDGTSFDEEVRSARRQLIAQHFAGEFEAACRALLAIARADVATRDFALPAIRRVLASLLVHFPVYRTYADENGRDADDAAIFAQAARATRASLRTADHALLDAIDGWLGGVAPGQRGHAGIRSLCLRAITRFQQLTPPLAAKSVEDTAFYRYGRLLSRNEVGADPMRFSLQVAEFHEAAAERARCFPDNLLATATHDHKRGEDVRARLAVLSELPDEWARTLRRWVDMNAGLRTGGEPDGPEPGDELMLYQTVVGAWPFDLKADDGLALKAYATRVDQWQTKALREAKRRSGWALPDEAYEDACRRFLFAMLDPMRSAAFLADLENWVARIACAGAANSLAQTVLRLTSPGVPDLYQGTELWDFSLVDPDNRRPVDYSLRSRLLEAGGLAADHAATWRDGQVKLQIIHAALTLRKQMPEVFAEGGYVPLTVDGPGARHVVAFLRQQGEQAVMTVTTRLPAALMQPETGLTIPADAWGDTAILLPAGLPPAAWSAPLSGGRVESSAGRLWVRDVLARLPVAILANPPHPGAAKHPVS